MADSLEELCESIRHSAAVLRCPARNGAPRSTASGLGPASNDDLAGSSLSGPAYTRRATILGALSGAATLAANVTAVAEGPATSAPSTSSAVEGVHPSSAFINAQTAASCSMVGEFTHMYCEPPPQAVTSLALPSAPHEFVSAESVCATNVSAGRGLEPTGFSLPSMTVDIRRKDNTASVDVALGPHVLRATLKTQDAIGDFLGLTAATLHNFKMTQFVGSGVDRIGFVFSTYQTLRETKFPSSEESGTSPSGPSELALNAAGNIAFDTMAGVAIGGLGEATFVAFVNPVAGAIAAGLSVGTSLLGSHFVKAFAAKITSGVLDSATSALGQRQEQLEKSLYNYTRTMGEF